jgi:hypothetical protein
VPPGAGGSRGAARARTLHRPPRQHRSPELQLALTSIKPQLGLPSAVALDGRPLTAARLLFLRPGRSRRFAPAWGQRALT